MSRKHLFFGTTTYHLLLFGAICTDIPKGDIKKLIFAPNNACHLHFGKKLINGNILKFSHYEIIDNTTKKVRPIRVLAKIYQSRCRAPVIGKSYSPDCIYTAKDRKPLPQSILNSSKRANLIYVEDGMHAYSNNALEEETNWKETLKKVLYGSWYKSTNIYGTYGTYDAVAALYPEYLRHDLVYQDTIQIKLDGLNQDIKKWRWEDEKEFNEIKNEIDVLFVLDHSSQLDKSKKTVAKIKNKIKSEVKEGGKVGIKYHPREVKEYIHFEDSSNISILPSYIPSELILVSSAPKNVYGSSSTFMISAKSLDKKLDIVAMIDDRKTLPSNIKRMYKSLGIQIVHTT